MRGVGVWPHTDPLWEKRIKEWQDNDIVLRRASRKAIKMDFGSFIEAEDSSAQEASESDTIQKLSASKRGRSNKFGSPTDTRSSTKSDQLEKNEHISTGSSDADDPLQLSREELLSMTAWASRHHASQLVGTLEATNRGLSEALVHVVAQRDALLEIVRMRS